MIIHPEERKQGRCHARFSVPRVVLLQDAQRHFFNDLWGALQPFHLEMWSIGYPIGSDSFETQLSITFPILSGKKTLWHKPIPVTSLSDDVDALEALDALEPSGCALASSNKRAISNWLSIAAILKRPWALGSASASRRWPTILGVLTPARESDTNTAKTWGLKHLKWKIRGDIFGKSWKYGDAPSGNSTIYCGKNGSVSSCLFGDLPVGSCVKLSQGSH